MKRTAALALVAVGATLLAVGALACKTQARFPAPRSSSATSRQLVFATNGDGVSGTLELATVRPDGSRFRKLTRHGGPAFRPRWTSDGKSIVFSSYDEFTDRDTTWRMRRDGSARELLPGGKWNPPSPSGELVAPDGERLVSSSGEIFVVDRRGRRLRRLTEWAWDDEPQWSPNGRRLAFVRGSNVYATSRIAKERTLVYVMSSEGKRQRRVGRGSEPRWSPDGDRLAFARSISPASGPPRDRIVVADVDGRGRREIAGLDPAWSPDGERLAFVRHVYDEAMEGVWVEYASTLLIARADGTDLRELGDKDWLLFDPQWSPDGRTIAVSARSEDLQESRLQLVDVETGAVRTLREPQPDSFAWSPDGRRIAFAECQAPREVAVLAVIDVETGSTRTVAKSTGADSCPRYESFAWSPDGTRIAYIHCTFDADFNPTQCDVYTVNADGSQPRRITSTPGIERSLDW